MSINTYIRTSESDLRLTKREILKLSMTITDLKKYPHYILYLRMMQVAFIDGMMWEDSKGVEKSLDSGISTAPQVYAKFLNESTETVLEIEGYIPISTIVLILTDKMTGEVVRLMFEFSNKKELHDLLVFFDDYHTQLDILNYNDHILNLSDSISVSDVSKNA